MGSSAVPGLAGKNIIDLLMAAAPVDPVVFSNAKHDWIVAILSQLGPASDQHHRLYDGHPNLDGVRLAS